MAFTNRDLNLIDLKFEGLTKLMNAHFENVQDKQDHMIKKQDITNDQVIILEKKVNTRNSFCEKIQAIKIEKNKYKVWKLALMILAAAILASIITNFGLLEFLKFIK